MRIGIVNDMPIAVELLRRILVSTAEHQLAWIAMDGAQAVAMCQRDLPDLLLMDLTMPVMDGVEATRRIMQATPCPILLVTASVEHNVPGVYEAMGHGALDAVDMPQAGVRGDGAENASVLLARIATIGKLVRDVPARPVARKSPPAIGAPASSLVAIGASAGGPAAVAAVLGKLPADFPAAIVLVQHLDEQFVAGLADWLGRHTALSVRAAIEGDRPVPGTVLVASTSDHLVFKSSRELGYAAEPRQHIYRPSIDVFFESAARWWQDDLVGVLLTGMGRDGATGLKTLRERQHLTIAQDRATSAVYGMPKAAAELGAAAEILPLDSIASRLVDACLRAQV
ncbi:chemotaxis response regulator protein-glutamate methylesterase [Kaistia sp. 32K]|uniref:chemotaxis-specific protein-glutamate methyltransferase CheB n=1 Tax=Kaistia sp. 32K TaxID=2795690 RepID=UPI001916B1E5|nr:chemotaxis-specific protein-glutamate methyltransferase CheB [Kaistia sp. 32K]BCP55747.1 chemotaxis response regulator protein-glutamate methylesterase [Kaistia sp. 32K]